MIPEYTLPNEFTPAPFQPPFAGKRDSRIDFARGGTALNDANNGLDIQDWKAELVKDRTINLSSQSTGFTVKTKFNSGYVFQDDADNISLAFDNNMQPMIAYETNNRSILRWFDVNVSQYVDLIIPARNGIVRVDDPRPIALSVRDCIFSYVRNNVLCCRIFRDRFLVEYPFWQVHQYQKLYQAGMNANLCFQWEFVWDHERMRGC